MAKRERKGKRFQVVVALCVLLIAVGASLTYISWSSPEVKSFDMYLNVSTYMGINVDTDAIRFGTVPSPGTASRIVMLKNLDVWSRWVDIRAEGPLASWVSVDANGFVLAPGQEMNITVRVVVPENASHGSYTGRLDVVFRRVLFGLL